VNQGEQGGAGGAAGAGGVLGASGDGGEERGACRRRAASRDSGPMRALLLAGMLLLPGAAAAQAWNSDSALALVARAVARRSRAAADTSLHDYKAQAHGFLFFLGQFGEGLSEPPRLIKADQLELEVYWKAPGASKQRIVGWRDRADIPTDINYHRDHLGIVQNNFGRVIRLGEGDEVRDVPHPLSPGAAVLYDYALDDTLRIVLPDREVRVVALRVRPKDFDAPRLVGTLYLDAATAELVRLAFNFTPRAYLEPDLEDVSIVLDNALWQDRWWLPYRQEIEIRRRTTWLDLPARGIIRGRWEIDGYQFNLGLVDTWFLGDEITTLPKAERDSFPWPTTLGAAIEGVAEPVREGDLETIRVQAARIAGRRALTGLRRAGLGARGVSDLIHSNRVEGLTPGAGVVWRGGGDRVELRARAGYGFASRSGTGAVSLLTGSGPDAIEARGYREVRDVGDVPVIAPFLNSLGAQEFGDDYGDYYRADGGRLTWRHGLGGRSEWWLGTGRDWVRGLPVRAAPASGTFRPNPDLGDGGVDVVQLGARRKSEGFAVRRDLYAEVTLEAGRRDGGQGYARLAAAGHLLLPVGVTRVLVRAEGGVAGPGLPPHRAFVLGGRATLLGDDFRAWGGARALLVHAEWRLPVALGPLRAGGARVPTTLTVAPFAAAGWSGAPVAGTSWRAAPGTRVTVGAALEWLGVLRLEAGYGLQSRRAHLAFDVTRDFWGIL
jgi:hypothetical protein